MKEHTTFKSIQQSHVLVRQSCSFLESKRGNSICSLLGTVDPLEVINDQWIPFGSRIILTFHYSHFCLTIRISWIYIKRKCDHYWAQTSPLCLSASLRHASRFTDAVLGLFLSAMHQIYFFSCETKTTVSNSHEKPVPLVTSDISSISIPTISTLIIKTLSHGGGALHL